MLGNRITQAIADACPNLFPARLLAHIGDGQRFQLFLRHDRSRLTKIETRYHSLGETTLLLLKAILMHYLLE